MRRSFTYSAITLRVKQSGESNREAWFLTAEEGVIRATVFGGPKSRLRARVAPFHEGELWVYYDPVRDSRKANDFDVRSYRPGIRELYERAMTADAAAETILASCGGGGNWTDAAQLTSGFLDALNDADAALCCRLGVYFLWHWAEILGVRPDLATCTLCARAVPREQALIFLAASEGLFCEHCAHRENPSPTTSRIRVDGGARLWLGGIENLPPEAIARVTLDNTSLHQAKSLSKAILARTLEKWLSTWDSI